jgi:hypothetical protein
MGIPQGDLRLLHGEVAKRLLSSTIPARLAYIAKDGTPRVIPSWFHWNGGGHDFSRAGKPFIFGIPSGLQPARNLLS